MAPIRKVVVVGAGPCGMLLALLLAPSGIEVDLLEKENKLDDSPRAAFYDSNAMIELSRAGLGPEIEAAAFYARHGSWRSMDNKRLFGFEVDEELEKENVKAGKQRTTVLPLRDLLPLFHKQIQKYSNIRILFDHNVTGIGQDDDKAWVEVRQETGLIERHEADYIVGCDGGNSIVRRSLFGDREFPGFTWDQTLVATNVYYDFYKHGLDDVNNFIHPENGFLATRITKDGLWRVSYGEVPGLTNEEYLKRLPMKYENILPGHPKPGEYKLLSARSYRCHQRLAKQMRVGRMVLLGDAAHLTNPFGGFGLTNGICDTAGFADCLIAINEGKATADKILTVFNNVRRRIFNEIVNPSAIANMKRVFSDPEVEKNSPTALMFKRAAKDKEFAKSLSSAHAGLRYDFSQHFDLVA